MSKKEKPAAIPASVESKPSDELVLDAYEKAVAEYEAISQEAGGFDAETRRLVRAKEDEVKALVESRKADRADLLNRKMVAYRAVTSATAASKPAAE